MWEKMLMRGPAVDPVPATRPVCTCLSQIVSASVRSLSQTHSLHWKNRMEVTSAEGYGLGACLSAGGVLPGWGQCWGISCLMPLNFLVSLSASAGQFVVLVGGTTLRAQSCGLSSYCNTPTDSQSSAHGGETTLIKRKLCICGLSQDFLDLNTDHRVQGCCSVVVVGWVWCWGMGSVALRLQRSCRSVWESALETLWGHSLSSTACWEFPLEVAFCPCPDKFVCDLVVRGCNSSVDAAKVPS